MDHMFKFVYLLYSKKIYDETLVPFVSHIVIELDWMLVSEKKECKGPEIWAGKLKTLADCAQTCRGISSMFIYGAADLSNKINVTLLSKHMLKQASLQK